MAQRLRKHRGKSCRPTLGQLGLRFAPNPPNDGNQPTAMITTTIKIIVSAGTPVTVAVAAFTEEFTNDVFIS